VKRTVDNLANDLRGALENIVYLSEVDSTHAQSIRLMSQLDEEGLELNATVIIAGRQTRGVGRGVRKWESPQGGLYLNWMRSGLSQETIGRLPMIAAAAAYRAVVDLGVSSAVIKWPNDILVDGRKLAGILVHARQGTTYRATVGMGVNLLSAPAVDSGAAQPATALAEHIAPAPYSTWCRAIATSFVRSLTASLDDADSALDSWRRSLIHTLGDTITVRMASGEIQTGTFNGLTDEGFLRLRQGDEERVITGGDVVEQG